jgi:hypothetical protein
LWRKVDIGALQGALLAGDANLGGQVSEGTRA